jgi:putative endonuclease
VSLSIITHTRSTKGYVPWELIFEKEVVDRKEARRVEKYFKSGVGKEYLKTLNLTNGPVVQRIE